MLSINKKLLNKYKYNTQIKLGLNISWGFGLMMNGCDVKALLAIGH